MLSKKVNIIFCTIIILSIICISISAVSAIDATNSNMINNSNIDISAHNVDSIKTATEINPTPTKVNNEDTSVKTANTIATSNIESQSTSYNIKQESIVNTACLLPRWLKNIFTSIYGEV